MKKKHQSLFVGPIHPFQSAKNLLKAFQLYDTPHKRTKQKPFIHQTRYMY